MDTSDSRGREEKDSHCDPEIITRGEEAQPGKTLECNRLKPWRVNAGCISIEY